MDVFAFYAFAAIAILASLFVVSQPNPMHSVMLLITSFGALAGLYVLLDAPFTAVTQIIIYAGAIMVLFLFVVMLLNVPREEPAPPASVMLGPTGMRMGMVLSVLLAVEVVWAMSRVGAAWFSQGPSAASVSSVRLIGVELFTRHAFAFEATSILILVAMVGAVVLAGKVER
ncbi:MAG TPA: NADH-quinone oxidoreductase subunit J [Vicinamibacterales bacterium]|jgi:NADH-quinone oxidoreductase subunit J|nr:NADH-quinone oxidoreductase subunit J [Vicinamibacterales bacterium]